MDNIRDKENLIDKIIERVNSSEISSIKTVILQILNTLTNPNTSAKELKEVIQFDPPLAAKILKGANSAFYSPRTKIEEIEKAVVWLGFGTVRELAISQKAYEIFNSDELYVDFSRKELWKQCVGVALFNKALHQKECGDRGETAYTTGLLHQIGLIAIEQFLNNKFKEILERTKNESKNIFEIENEILGIDHADLGRAILENWGLSENISIATGFHHKPHLAPQPYGNAVLYLYISDYICQIEHIGFRDAKYPNEKIFEDALERLKTNFRSLEVIAEDVKNQIAKMTEDGLL